MKNFKVVIEVNDELTIFNSFKNTEKAMAFIDIHANKSLAKSIKMYEFDKNAGGYLLTLELMGKAYCEEPKPVGFGRW